MKKILLGTTGLVAVALIATAASAETPKVTLGGFSNFQSGWTNDDQDAGLRSNGFRNDNQVTVKVDGKNGGLGYGAEIDLAADTTSDPINRGVNAYRTFTYLSGNWGRVEMGDNKSAAATMRVDASTLAAASGGIGGSWAFFINGTTSGSGFISGAALPSEHGAMTGALADGRLFNATKISYYTPKFSGFQAGISYTPQLSDRGIMPGKSDTAGAADVVDLGLSYEGTFSGVKLAAAGTYESAQGNGTAANGYGTDDIRAWNLGALVGFQGFSVAGSYGDWIDSGRTGIDGYYWTAGLGYSAGPVGLSATYINSVVDDTTAVDNEYSNIVLGADYKLAAGLTPYAEVSFFDFDGNAGASYDNQGTIVILGTQVAF